MVSLEEKYYPIHNVSDLEKTGLDGVGCVVAVINRQGQAYIVREPPDKGSGLNVVTEKRRQGESIMDNVRGALVEEMGLTGEDLKDFWYFPGRISLVGGAPFPHNGLNVHADVVVIYYSGDKESFASRNEVEGIGFMDLVALYVDEKFREASKPALRLIFGYNIHNDVRDMHDVLPRIPVFPSGFDPDIFFENRQKLPDLFHNS